MLLTTGRPRRRGRVVATALATAAVAGAMVLAGCSHPQSAHGSSPTSRADTSPEPLHACPAAGCTGTLDGARYQVLTPARWNGTVLLYSHGYRFAQPVPPDFATPSTDPVPAPGADVAKTLLSQGYVLAGSSFSRNGWDVVEGVTADEQLYQLVRREVGVPRRVYLWGDSLGGLITQVLAEKHPAWVSGAAPLCGVLGGTDENLDLALDLAYATRQLVAPRLQLTGYASHQAAVKQWQYAERRLVATARGGGDGPARIALLAALVDAPAQTAHFDGSTPQSRVGAAVEAALTGLGYGTYGRYEIEQRVGGDPSTNTAARYADRISPAERQVVDLLGGPGTTSRLLATLQSRRVSASTTARRAARALGEPTGRLAVPTVTLHTTQDPLVLVQNERLFADRVAAAGRQDQLLQLFVQPPSTFTSPAPYGAGHCSFTSAQRLAAVRLLDGWVRSGERPTGQAVHQVVASTPGLVSGWTPPPWPAALTS